MDLRTNSYGQYTCRVMRVIVGNIWERNKNTAVESRDEHAMHTLWRGPTVHRRTCHAGVAQMVVRKYHQLGPNHGCVMLVVHAASGGMAGYSGQGQTTAGKQGM